MEKEYLNIVTVKLDPTVTKYQENLIRKNEIGGERSDKYIYSNTVAVDGVRKALVKFYR